MSLTNSVQKATVQSTAVGETKLAKLLSSMSPVLTKDDYVFLSFENAEYGDYAELEPIASIVEAEGLSLVVTNAKAEKAGFYHQPTYRLITLEVHSSLDAIGLTAAFAAKLTEVGISANVVAGYFHDHIFVGKDDAKSAMDALKQLSSESIQS